MRAVLVKVPKRKRQAIRCIASNHQHQQVIYPPTSGPFARSRPDMGACLFARSRPDIVGTEFSTECLS